MRSTSYTTCAVALAASLSMPAFAQGTGTGTSPGSTATTAETTFRGDDDGGFDLGWLGLLGLVGLVGLRRKPDVLRPDVGRASVPR